MSDLISRQASIDALERRLAEPSYQHSGEDWYVGMNSAVSELYEIPSADRPQGRWEHQELAPTNWTFCSVCGRQRSKKYKWYYCPNCGARMKGADDEND